MASLKPTYPIKRLLEDRGWCQLYAELFQSGVVARQVYVGDLYLGDMADVKRLEQRGIREGFASVVGKRVATLGFSPSEQKWFGWSLRAISGFGVGDVVTEGDAAATSLPVGFKAETLDDARRIAAAFARAMA